MNNIFRTERLVLNKHMEKGLPLDAKAYTERYEKYLKEGLINLKEKDNLQDVVNYIVEKDIRDQYLKPPPRTFRSGDAPPLHLLKGNGRRLKRTKHRSMKRTKRRTHKTLIRKRSRRSHLSRRQTRKRTKSRRTRRKLSKK